MLEGLFDADRWSTTFQNMGPFWEGFGVTLQVVVAGLLLSLVLGTLLGVFSTTRSRVLRAISRVYVEFYQNTPLPVQVLFMYIIPIKIKYLAIVDAVFFAYSVIANSFPVNLLPLVALINFFIFCGGELFALLPRRPSKNTVNFRQESARIRREQKDKLYTHKCAVCGRTDVDHPELEFRYCSKCQGYHCFCSDHIFNHEHFRE